MKKIFLIFLLILIPLFDQSSARMVIGSGSSAVVDYTQDANCQGAWYMNGATGATETDRSGNGNTLSDAGTIPSSSTVPTGYVGKSKDFTSASAHALGRADGSLVGLDINGASAKVSVVFWMKIDAIANGATLVPISKYATSTSQRQYTVRAVATATSKFKITGVVSPDGTATGAVDSTKTDYDIATWYHIAFVDNNTDLRIYVDGSLNCTPVAYTSGLFNGNASFYIGRMEGTYYDGLIDEVAVFDRELSSAEVLDIYTNGISGNKGGSD